MVRICVRWQLHTRFDLIYRQLCRIVGVQQKKTRKNKRNVHTGKTISVNKMNCISQPFSHYFTRSSCQFWIIGKILHQAKSEYFLCTFDGSEKLKPHTHTAIELCGREWGNKHIHTHDLSVEMKLLLIKTNKIINNEGGASELSMTIHLHTRKKSYNGTIHAMPNWAKSILLYVHVRTFL